MKNLYRNSIILAVASCFLALNLIGENAGARSRADAPTPTPKAKKSPTATVKVTPKATLKPTAKKSPTPKPKLSATPKTPTNPIKKPTPKPTATPAATVKPTPKPTSTLQVMVIETSSRVREKPAAGATQIIRVKLGKILPVAEKNTAWFRVQYADGKSGWISKTNVRNFETAKRDEVYLAIADKYTKNKKLDFATATEVADFLRAALAAVKSDELEADLSRRRLRVLAAALKAIPFGKGEQPPYKTFVKANEKEVVYSEPSGEWYVRSDLFWELHNKYTTLPIAEEIAWEAAQNPIPGECEGYINCYLYLLRATDGEYLNFYPNGKYSKKALLNITNLLEPIVADSVEKKVYTAPSDISDRAEFNRFLTELRTIISKVPNIEKAKTLQQITQLGEGYK